MTTATSTPLDLVEPHSTKPRRRTPRMLIVANRLPVNRVGRGDAARWQSSAGGLVTALEPIVRSGGGSWVGWSGAAGKAPDAFTHQGVRIQPVGLSQGDVEQFYHGMSNSTFWPLYHDAIRPPEFHRDWWWKYVEVNERFARVAAAAAEPGDLLWVHDYHLQLVPRMIRALRDDVRIGFFLHIPFPPEELFAWLPWRAQILEGLLGADLIGFQTTQAAQNFCRAAAAYTSAKPGREESLLSYEGRTVSVRGFPIAIDTKWFEDTAASDAVSRQAADIRRKVGAGGKRKIMLCVDRLDYTKGIDVRLSAYEELLRRGRFTADDCVLMQIAVPSRERVSEYVELRTRIEQMVGRINGEYSTPGRVAVHYFRRNLQRQELVAYYRAADVMLVTPLRDGMNLVAKEYVATRVDGSGVLVLSEFAGAARELDRALLVNPRDEEGMAQTMEAALSCAEDDARERMMALRAMVRRHDVFEWAGQFVEAMRS